MTYPVSFIIISEVPSHSLLIVGEVVAIAPGFVIVREDSAHGYWGTSDGGRGELHAVRLEHLRCEEPEETRAS